MFLDMMSGALYPKYGDYEKEVSNLKRKINRKLLLPCIVVGGAWIYFCIKIVLPIVVAMGTILFGSALEKPVVVTDIEDYQNYSKYIGEEADRECAGFYSDQLAVFPEKLTGEVREFKHVYYNPFDPQVVSYLTVKYDDDEYNKELNRLKTVGSEDYIGYYSVTGKPNGYNMVAMDSDEYHGFCYGITPETEDNTITYVGILFCNYFLDLNINKYLPEKYLLTGFDATMDNPYKKEMMRKK